MVERRSRPLRVFVSHTAELASYPPALSFVDAACAGIRRVDGVPVTMLDFGARQEIPLEVCRSEVLSCDVHLSLIGFRYGTVVPELDDDISYTEFEFEVATAAGLPRLVFLIDDQTPLPPALVDHDRTQISRFRQRVRDGTDHLATVLVGDPGRLEAAVSQALVRIGRLGRLRDARSPAVAGRSGRASRAGPPGPELDLESLVFLLASYFGVEGELVDRHHAADILRGLEGTPQASVASLERALARTANRRRRYFGTGSGVPGASEQLAVALAIVEPSCRTADWVWGWDSRSLDRLEKLAHEDE